MAALIKLMPITERGSAYRTRRIRHAGCCGAHDDHARNETTSCGVRGGRFPSRKCVIVECNFAFDHSRIFRTEEFLKPMRISQPSAGERHRHRHATAADQRDHARQARHHRRNGVASQLLLRNGTATPDEPGSPLHSGSGKGCARRTAGTQHWSAGSRGWQSPI